jgi:hypothetical protein
MYDWLFTRQQWKNYVLFLKSGINNPEKLLLICTFFLGHLASSDSLNCMVFSQRAVRHLIRQLNIEGAMEIVIIMAWSIWKYRDGWIFENIPPTIERCAQTPCVAAPPIH